MAAQTAAEDAKAYYGYLIEGDDKNKRASPVLEALLRAIAQYIIDEIGDKNEKHLTPNKLAAFYKAVGGDYDALFHEVPYKAISYIWQVTGCQHTLQPGDDDYAEPNIPALTVKGFVRWETIEILLAPEEHVPFMQYAVRHWNLKNPDDGKVFPPDLPKEAFPAETDPAIDRWHHECATKLRSDATPKEDDAKDEQPHKHSFHDSGHRVREFYNHVRAPAAMAAGGLAGVSAAAAAASARLRPDKDYFAARPVGVSYTSGRYPPSRQGSGMAAAASARSPDREKDRYPRRHGSSSDERHHGGHPRRRSFGDYPSPAAQHDSPTVAHANTAPPHFDEKGSSSPQPRRHSQPRHYSSPSDSDDDDEPVSPKTRRREPPPAVHHHHAEPPPLAAGVRRFYPTSAAVGGRAGVPVPTAVPPIQIPVDDRVREGRQHRGSSGSRSDDPRRRSFPSPHDLKDRLVSMIPGIGAVERPRSGSRGHRDRDRDRERERERDRERNRHSHEHLPSTSSRLGHSWSNEDGDSEDNSDTEDEKSRRRRRERERDREHDRKLRDRERDRDRDRDRHGGGGDRRDRDRHSDRDREREREKERDRDREHRRGRDKDDRRRERESTDGSLSPRSRKNTGGSGGGVGGAYLQRPDVPRRPSSHADLDRRRDRDWDRERDREERWRREERERRRELDRDRDRDRMPSPVVTGVGGRRYPTELRTG